MKKNILINDDFVGTRVDRWFRKKVSELPQSLIEKFLRKGKIKVNNKRIKSSYKLKINDLVFISNLNIDSSKNKRSQNKYVANEKEISSLSKIFIENNDNFAVINKPAGIAVQGGTKLRKNLIDILKKTKEFQNSYPYPVHRIDKDTTGILIVAKNRKYAQLLTSLFRIRKIHKIYLGIIIGELSNDKGTFVDDLFYYEGKKKIISFFCINNI